MILREYEEYNEIFVQNPNTKKMECLSLKFHAWDAGRG